MNDEWNFNIKKKNYPAFNNLTPVHFTLVDALLNFLFCYMKMRHLCVCVFVLFFIDLYVLNYYP